jgi:hypothetical protein
VTYRKALRQVRDGCIYLDSGSKSQSSVAAAVVMGANPGHPFPVVVAAPPAPYPQDDDWDASQSNVIEQSKDARILVDAGPGTGKTAVACARVAHLIKLGVEPVNCWIISFTRTAVQEIRNRIATYLGDAASAAAVTIATIDSHAWSLHSGFDKQAKLSGLYDDNIEAAIEKLRSDRGLAEYIEQIEHLIVDEAQDVVGVRADFVETLIGKLQESSGVSVFADHAQSIYGFAEEENASARQGVSPLLVRLTARLDFRAMSLDEVHRTGSETLRKIFTDVRKMVLASSSEPPAKRRAVEQAITELAEQSGFKAGELKIAELPPTALVLFRRRAEALTASSYCGLTPHRLRLSGLPSAIHPWVAACFFDNTGGRVTESEFCDLWRTRASACSGDLSCENAWRLLIEIAGANASSIDMRLLRRRLGRQQAPAQFVSAELGLTGPVIGTIHASKGREADAVFLMMPKPGATDIETDEETRVIFVGATRARSHLFIGEGSQIFPRNLPSGRAWRSPAGKERTLIVEFGRDGDLSASGLAGLRAFPKRADAETAQQRCVSYIKQPVLGAVAISDAKSEYAYRLYDPQTEKCVAVFSERLNNDLWQLSNEAASKVGQKNAKPPEKIPHLRFLGARSIVLPPDSPESELLHEPWASSGFMMAPVVLGFSKVWFRPYVKR